MLACRCLSDVRIMFRLSMYMVICATYSGAGCSKYRRGDRWREWKGTDPTHAPRAPATERLLGSPNRPIGRRPSLRLACSL